MSTSNLTTANPDLNDTFGNIEPPSPEQVARARRVVAGMSCNATEARQLLAMLGIDG